MEVILIKPIKKLGQIGQIISAKKGFVRNWLIPQNIAIRATEENKKLIETQKQELEEKNQKAKAEAEAIAKIIDQKDLIFIRQSAEDGKLFGSVNSKEIANELMKISSSNISSSFISIDTPIKSLGIHQIDVILHPEIICKITVVIARSETEAHDSLRIHKAPTTETTEE